jgi:hypothetical protein
VWSSRWPRDGSQYPRPAYWPATAGLGHQAEANAPRLDDPRVDEIVARGPSLDALQGGTGYGNLVRREWLDPSRGWRQGFSDLEREFPLLTTLGRYRTHSQTEILDNEWQDYHNPRRTQILYILAKAPAEFSGAYLTAILAIVRAPFRPALAPLDRDDEFIAYGQRFGWGGAPDFHPYLGGFCDFDPKVADERTKDLVGRINNLPRTMTQAFINLYERVIQELQRRINANPRPPADQIAAMQQEISQSQAKIDQLNQYLQSLPQ